MRKAQLRTSSRASVIDCTLYIAGQSSHSVTAIANLKALQQQYPHINWQTKTIDLLVHPERSSKDHIIAIPTLVVQSNGKTQRIIGNLSDHEAVAHTLALDGGNGKSKTAVSSRSQSVGDAFDAIVVPGAKGDRVFSAESTITNAIVESISEAFVAMDPTWRLIYVNRRAEELLGRPRHELLGMVCWDVFGTSKNSPAYINGHHAMREQITLTYEHYMPQLAKWFRAKLYPSKRGLTVFFEDITALKITEQQLAQSEARFRALMNSNIIGVVTAHRDGRILEANDAFVRLVGYTKNELSGHAFNWQELIPREYRESAHTIVRELEEHGFLTPIEIEYVRKDGSRVPVIIGGTSVDRGQGEAVLFALDITERKKLEERKDEFIGIASHELKTPLTSIKGYTQILEKQIRESGNGKAAQYIDKINTYINRLNILISDLLDVSRIQAGKLQFNITTFDFDALVQESIDAIQPTAPRHNIIKRGSARSQVTGDRNRLEQVITNLLTNAVKYSPDAQTIEVTVRTDDERVELTVTDYGIGIAPEEQARLFDRFYRVEGTASQFSGLGIGLYISNEIVRRHGGEMGVRSEPGKGASFWFTIPLQL